MNMTIIKKMPTVEDVIQQFPLSDKGYEAIAKNKQEVKDILAGRDDRLLMIVGPCSAWPYDSVVEYASRLKELSSKVDNKLKLVMRTYIQKPRTTKGWTGPVNQPDPYGTPDIEEGIKYARSLMVKILEMGVPIADEALFTHNAKGFLELLSWVAIGARSAEDQEHRVFASAIDCAVGMKNPTSGVLKIGVNSVVAAQYPHIAVFNGEQVETHGNKYAHLVLRGGSITGPNHHIENIYAAKQYLEGHGVVNPAVVVDASHDNTLIGSKKDYKRQPHVIHEVLDNLKYASDVKKLVKGFMVESFIQEGNQSLDKLNAETIDKNGLSVTDACLGWEDTEKMILEVAEKL